ncbi:mannosyl-oligosaccharide alpha-1 [Emericellopsis cladophorae]|uniref:alpha-1,2-Mannosidase n=1 Tax=Emericellopsis cladophorae TaxID=2686198 RepID=A0A9P9XW67_9HYPO|nr:mannosyl-oligosaccharide alpha-1 [Emericellopsis cladophorae]KAI6778959.1 mannosyl-oligosaccharide alpha-1 [Emericellopsis cladophorae]
MAPSRQRPRWTVITGAALAVLLLWYNFPGNVTRRQHIAPVDWSQARQYYPPETIKPLPTGHPRRPIPPVQASMASFQHPSATDPRRDQVQRVFERSWNAYKDEAWGQDELNPASGGGKETYGGWAATMVDALDTLWIMGMKDEFDSAAEFILDINFRNTTASAINLFEINIRHLGGLLSAHDLSGRADLLGKAVELGDMLYMAFDTPNGLPGFWFNFEEALDGTQRAGENDAPAAPASMCLEFTRLSQLTGDAKYFSAADRVTRFLARIQRDTSLPGLWPVEMDFRNELASSSRFYSIGAGADSLYEYLPKMHALLGGVDEKFQVMYTLASKQIQQTLLFRPMLPDNEDILFLGNAQTHEFSPGVTRDYQSQHLTCFAGGMFGLGGKLFEEKGDLELGERLARGCGWAYSQFPSGVMPEMFGFFGCPSLEVCEWDEERWRHRTDRATPKGWRQIKDPRYLLRPEAVESIFLLYRMTGHEDLRDLAWEMFLGMVGSTETELAYSGIANVMKDKVTEKLDTMDSFWMAETLKYFYLLFSTPDTLSLDEWVLNTEAHPFRRPG